MDYGSTYNPTGDPLFHMPYQLRIDAIINGNSQRLNNRDLKKRARPCAIFIPGKVKPIKTFDSVNECAAHLGVTNKTIQSRIRRETLLDKKYLIRVLES